jgi:hypothetical protein
MNEEKMYTTRGVYMDGVPPYKRKRLEGDRE